MANVFCLIRNYDWEEPNLIQGLKQSGHNVIGWFDWKEEKDKEKIFNGIMKTIDFVGSQKIDLLFSYLSAKQISAANILNIKNKFSIPMLNISCNDMTNWRKGSGPIASQFDYCWTMTKNALYKFQAVNANAFALPLAVNHEIYRPLNIEKEYDVIFIGSPIADRLDYINHLRYNGIKVKVFSSHSNDRPLTSEEMVVEYNKAKIALSFTKMADGNEVRLRSFEIPACRTLHMSEYCYELEKYFKQDEICMFKNKDELLESTQKMLADHNLRENIVDAGYNRVMKDHTWITRYDQVFKNIDLKI